jgi:16S rRNA (guanine527-N7)-methyltransferase
VEDCLRVLGIIDFNDKRVIDIGSGAGFPGLILAIFQPQMQITLLEADQKKSRFLRLAREELGLKNVEVINRRVEEAGHDNDFRETFDLCTARAVAAMNIMLEYGIPLLKIDGKLLLWKGRNHQEEIILAENALRILNAEVKEVIQYSLMEEFDRVIVVVKKYAASPDKYPRRVGIPSKRPL